LCPRWANNSRETAFVLAPVHQLEVTSRVDSRPSRCRSCPTSQRSHRDPQLRRRASWHVVREASTPTEVTVTSVGVGLGRAARGLRNDQSLISMKFALAQRARSRSRHSWSRPCRARPAGPVASAALRSTWCRSARAAARAVDHGGSRVGVARGRATTLLRAVDDFRSWRATRVGGSVSTRLPAVVTEVGAGPYVAEAGAATAPGKDITARASRRPSRRGNSESHRAVELVEPEEHREWIGPGRHDRSRSSGTQFRSVLRREAATSLAPPLSVAASSTARAEPLRS
jgi:hypothetical protein